MSVQKRDIIVAKQAREELKKLLEDKDYRDEKNQQYLKEDFIHFLNGLPVFISQNGLLQAMSFISDKKKKLLYSFENHLNIKNLVDTIIDLNNLKEYVILQTRAVEFSVWLKQIANALYKNPASQ